VVVEVFVFGEAVKPVGDTLQLEVEIVSPSSQSTQSNP
jgi:hypothetical protein